MSNFQCRSKKNFVLRYWEFDIGYSLLIKVWVVSPIHWTLNNYGITKDKTVILTCNTNFTEGGGMFLFRYLGNPDVKVHGESWVGWTRWMEYIKKRLQE